MNPLPAITRGDSIVQLLRIHQALSFSALQMVVSPPISRTRLRKVVTELVNKGVVRRRINRTLGGTSVYFEVAETLRMDSERGSLHHTHLIHNDLCAIAADILQRLVPGAICVREHAIPRNSILRTVMSYKDRTRDSLPDILLILPGQPGGAPAFVAVEVERSVKASKRLFRKLYKYAAQTTLDGVLYLSEDQRVLSAIRQHYRGKVAGRARRVGHYKDRFLVTAGCPTKRMPEFQQPRSSTNSAISLNAWMQALATVLLPARRDGPAAWGDSVGPGPLDALT
jgi:hypothetical protein